MNIYFKKFLPVLFIYIFTAIPHTVFAQTIAEIRHKASLQLMINRVKKTKLKCYMKKDLNTYFELSCHEGIEVITDLEGDCYANNLEEEWGKDCNSYSRITFTKSYAMMPKGSFIILVNPSENGIKKTEGSSVCGFNNSFSIISKSENLKYEALIVLEKQEYVNTFECIQYLKDQGYES